MTKTRRQMEKILPLIDLVAEICDARIPISSRNPDLTDIIKNKPRAILLNKCDMADKKTTENWLAYFKKDGITALPVDCRTGSGLSAFLPLVKNILKDRIEQNIKKGMAGKTLRIMVVGIPNVGKSSFINRMTNNKGAKVANRPGITRGNQWFSVDKTVELLDTPGILWHKFDDKTVAENLAFTGAVKDTVMDIEALSLRLIETLVPLYNGFLIERYKLTEQQLLLPSVEILEQIAINRGMKIKNNEVDYERAANMLFEEFRNCKIGRISLEIPLDV